jgi:protease-4
LIGREVWNITVSDSGNVKPFIASMSNVAASGGYYIACQADTIVADSTTITGSIGVISGRINLSGLLENKLFTHTDQLKFGEHSDLWEGSRLWTEEERLSLRQEIIDIYGTFLSRVADGRETLDSLDVHEVGIGKVWSGVEAKRLGLVDELGGLHRSIDIAKEAAGIDLGEDVIIEEYPRTKPFNFKLMFNMNNDAELLVWEGPLGEIKRSLDALPNFENDRMQMILPYEIIIK